MGGKHKQAQRTKNNARPSSSGRSAELLGNTAPSFVGFTAVKEGGFAPVLPGFTVTSGEEFDPNLNPNFHLVLKKMGKKDSTTKLKALQEFSELIRNSEPEAVKAVLPLWPRLYCHLAVDVEHRVREAAHQAQRAVVLRAKRNLAPYLRQLAGPWFTSQYDTYPPAATAAALAFQDAFPPNKMIEAIIFCQEEIFNYIYDNLIVQTPLTLSNPKTVTAEEMEAKYQRVVISSLQGYALYLQKLPAEQLKAALEANKKLITSKKFWKLSKHSSALIRNAWFLALIALCQNAPDLLTDEGSHVALAVFGNLDESDPIVLPTVWEASLHVLTTVENCWEHVSAEKLVLPKLWRILREGGQGNAAAIFPNLLPFLSKIPSTVFSKKQDFYDNFFDNMGSGMCQKSVYQSSAECNAVAKGYVECLQYIVMLHLNDGDFCQAVLKNHLIGAVLVMLKEEKLKLMSNALFSQVSGLVYHWTNNCSDQEYATLVQVFWESLTRVLLESFSNSSSDESLHPLTSPSSWLLKRHVDLCLSLKNPKQQTSQKLKVTFSTEDFEEDQEPENHVYNEPDDNVPIDKGLQSLVQTISASYLKKSKEMRSSDYLPYLAKLVKSFRSKELFLNLLHTNISENSETSTDALVNLYDTTLHKWLDDEKMCTEDVISIVFSLFEFLTPVEKDHVLETLCQMTGGSVLVWCMKAMLEHGSDPRVQKWLHSRQLSDILVSLASDICLKKPATDAKHILRYCLTKTKDGGLVISSEALSAILSEFSQNLYSSEKSNQCIDFVTELVKSLYYGDIRLSTFLHSNTAAEKLLLCLFQSNCQLMKIDNDAWCVGVSALARLHGSCSENFRMFSQKFAVIIKEELLAIGAVDIKSIDHLVSVVLKFLRAATKCFQTDVDETISLASTSVQLCETFLSCLLSTLTDRDQDLTDFCFYAEQLKGFLTFGSKYVARSNKQNDQETVVDPEIKLVQYLTLVLFSVTLISKCPDSWNPMEDEWMTDEENVTNEGNNKNDENDRNEENYINGIPSDSIHHLENNLLTITYSIAICESFSRHYKSSIYYYKVFSKYSVLLERFKQLMDTFDANDLEHITHATTKRAQQCGNLWLQALHLLKTKVLQQTDLQQIYDILTSESGNSCISVVDVNQVFLPYVKVEDMRTELTTLDIDKLLMVTSWLNNLEETIPVEYTESIRNLLDSVLIWYQQDEKSELLFDCKVHWPEVKTVAAAAKFLAATVEKCPELLTADHWDAIIVSVASWMLTMKYSRKLLLTPQDSCSLPLVPGSSAENLTTKSKKSHNNSTTFPSDKLLLDDHKGAIFTVAVFQLFKAITVFVENPRSDSESDDLKKFQEKVKTEWKDVFADDVHDALIIIFDAVAGAVKISSLSLLDLPLLESLGEAMLHIDPKFFFVSETKNNSAALDTMVKCCCQLIHSPVIPLQFTAYHILNRLVPGITELDTPAAFAASAVDKEGEGLSLTKLQETLIHTQTVVDTMLLGVRLGNSCTTVCPFTDAYTYTTAYLLLWATVLEMCGNAVSELRYQYATMLRVSGFLESLLQNVFRLMPEHVLQTTNPKFKLQKTSEMFSSPPLFEFGQDSSSEMLEHLSCWVYCSTLRRLPALVRHWWGDMEPKVASLVEQVTSTHCTPVLCSEEMKAIQGKDMKHGNMVVKVHPGAREVVAVYKVDEARMELSVHLPNNYPLGSVRVESGKQLVDTGQWRNWMKQLTVFLTHQNGSIWDGLILWKSNLDKKFEGVEECYICFSILHGTNFQIPRQTCSTCKKKFHSSCLYKWFSTSNKATCPICRNLF